MWCRLAIACQTCGSRQNVCTNTGNRCKVGFFGHDREYSLGSPHGKLRSRIKASGGHSCRRSRHSDAVRRRHHVKTFVGERFLIKSSACRFRIGHHDAKPREIRFPNSKRLLHTIIRVHPCQKGSCAMEVVRSGDRPQLVITTGCGHQQVSYDLAPASGGEHSLSALPNDERELRCRLGSRVSLCRLESQAP